MPRAEVRGVSLYYETHGWGNDADVVVLTNGVLMSTAGWAHQVGPVSRRWRLLLHDCRGMWKSEHPPGPYSLELHADDLVGLLDHLGVERAHLAGISYGAEVSLVCALRHPDRVASLFLAAAVAAPDELLRAQIEAWVAAAERGDAGLLWDLVYAASFSSRWAAAHPGERAAGRQRYAGLDLRAAAELLRAFLRFDVRGDLGRVRAPALVLVGEEDALKPRRHAEALARGIPGAEFLVVPGAGHALCLERPGAFNTALLGFLAQQAREGGKKRADG
ncbi:MAG: alpha/beta hydrolase [Candidatus Acetothermia bacterium]|jgi:3-oxoadipate enol-lactonase|nr:alpha/beta hydrolase [Candidatus Acetothermia bacterium]